MSDLQQCKKYMTYVLKQDYAGALTILDFHSCSYNFQEKDSHILYLKPKFYEIH